MSVISKTLKTVFKKNNSSNLEAYFKPFRDNIIGIDQEFTSAYGKQKVIYSAL